MNLLTRFVDPKNKLPGKVIKNRLIPKNQAVFSVGVSGFEPEASWSRTKILTFCTLKNVRISLIFLGKCGTIFI